MTSGITALAVAVGGTSLICYLLMNRAQNRSGRRERAGSDGSRTSTGGDGWNPFTWFGGDSSSSDSSGASSDSSGGDGGGGGGNGGGGGD